jgi:DNA repair protein SbcC/Rad50
MCVSKVEPDRGILVQLRRLRVKNIRSYESGTVDFPPGTTLLAGDVGAGKTSLLYAVEMALFGVAEVDATYLIRHSAAHAEVEVEFDDAEHRYRIFRRFRKVRRKGKESFEPEKIAFRVDGAETAYSATELRQRVIELLGFPDNPNPQAHSDLWRWAVYVPQERMRDILGARPQDRLETVRKALGVERYRTAAENAADLATDLRRSTNGRRQEAERLRHFDLEFAEATAESDRWHLERAALDRTIREREDAVAGTQQKLAEYDAILRNADADRRELESLDREQATDARAFEEATRARDARQREAERQRVAAALLEGEAAERETHRAALARAERERDTLRARLDAHESTMRSLAEARAELVAARHRASEVEIALGRAERDQAETLRQLEAARTAGPQKEPPAPTPRTVAEIDAMLSGARAEETEALSRLTRAQSSLTELDELLAAGVCPRCQQPVRAQEFEAHRAESATEVEGLERAYRAAGTAREGLEAERSARERFERAHERWTEVERRRSLASEALARAEVAVAAARESSRAAEEQLRASTSRVERLAQSETEESRLRSELARWEEERRRASDAIDRTTAAAERLGAARSTVEALEAELRRIESELERATERTQVRAARRASLVGQIDAATEQLRARADADRAHREAMESLEAERVRAARLDARLEDAARRIRSAERGRAERSALLEEANDLEQKAAWVAGPFRTALLTMEQKLLAHAQALFERNFARYFASLIDDPALVARTDPTFTPAVTIEGEWTPAEALSGGERTSLALAFRLALAQVVRSLGDLRLDTILLDEPTDGFSPEQVVRMGELLDELALPQVVIVSHESELAAIADRVVRVEKRDGRSWLTGPTVPRDGARSTEEEPAVEAPAARRRAGGGERAKPVRGASAGPPEAA